MSKYDLWLSEIPGIGSRTILKIMDAMNGETDFARTLYEMTPQERQELIRKALSHGRGGARPERIVRALNHSGNPGPDQCAEFLEEAGIRFCTILEEEYPERLRNIADPPFGLYCLGRFPSGTHPSVGIVGTRLASPYGREQARIYARKLAESGIQIVSGMARGIDGIAGRGALDADGDSFAVLGCGVDICYPPENRDLYGALCEKGGVISEYPPGTRPEARLFPARNRIISGLSDVLLVIEAREQSGTLITVDRALENGLDVFALPGRVTDRNSAGCNRLIRQGAGIATCPQDILDAIFGENGEVSPEQSSEGQVPGQLSFDFEVFANETSLPPEREEMTDDGKESGNVRDGRLDDGPDGPSSIPDIAAGAASPDPIAEFASANSLRGACRFAAASEERLDDGPDGPSSIPDIAAGAASPGFPGETACADFSSKSCRFAAASEESIYCERVRAADRAAVREEEETSQLRGLSPLQQAVCHTLDDSEAKCIDELLPAVAETLRRRVSYQEILRTLTLLSVKGRCREVRVGYYIAIHPAS